MPRLIALFLALLLDVSGFSQNPLVSWGTRIGGDYTDFAISTAVDANNNAFVSGQFSHVVDFDPGPNVYNMIAPFSTTYVVKLNDNGTLIWAIQFTAVHLNPGSTSKPEAICTDSNGNILVLGTFEGIVDFDPGPQEYRLTAQTSKDLYIAKLDPAGNFLWAKQVGGWPAPNQDLSAITTDLAGNVFVTGSFIGSVDFDPGSNVFQLVATGWDVFVLKLNSAGDFGWVNHINDTGESRGQSIVTDQSGNIYLTGIFGGSADFDPGPGILNLLESNGSAYILKLNGQGNLITVKQIGQGGFRTIGYSVKIDQAGNIFVIGEFQMTTDLDPGPGVFNLTSAGSFDLFVLKLDAQGNFIWVKGVGGPSFEACHSGILDVSGNIYLAGYFWSTVDFDPGPGVYTLTSTGIGDGFVARLNSAGNLDYAFKLGNTNNDKVQSISVNTMGSLYVAGNFYTSIDADACSGTLNLFSAGPLLDGFFIKYNASLLPTINISAPSTIVQQGNSVTVSSSVTNGGTLPLFQWQDSTITHSWQNISGATNPTLNYTPVQTGDRVKCTMISNAACANNVAKNSNSIVFTVNTVTSINPVAGRGLNIRFFPNPVHNSLHIDSLELSDRWHTLQILDLTGNPVLAGISLINKNKVWVDMQAVPVGAYLAILRRKDGSPVYFKFVKQ